MNILSFFISKAYAVSVNIPGFSQPSNAALGPSNWVVSFYNFALVISGVLAFGAIVYGGVKYATSAGNPSRQSDARSWITGALLGLLLLAGAAIILHTINPAIVTIQ